MRRFLIVVLLAACSSTPSGSTDGDTPASATIYAGDGQTGTAGDSLTVRPAVIVRDGSGNPERGVTVAFAIDSGGGSLATASSVTGSDGVATAGVWTLGPAAAATNVVSARVAGLATLRFHAQSYGAQARPIFTDASVGTGGATLQYTNRGDALNGISLTVPAAAYHMATQWTIVADSSVVAPLPHGFSQVGPTLVVSNGQGYADSLITLTIPLHEPDSVAVTPFYFDPTTGTLEAIPLAGRTDTSITLMAQHFSADLMAVPGRHGADLRTGPAPFGSVHVVWVAVPDDSLEGNWTTGFRPGVDDWEFVNWGDYVSPLGDCEGMSITELYYYYYIKPVTGAGLYHHYDVSLANIWDNVQGIRFAGSVQGDYVEALAHGVNQAQALTNKGKAMGLHVVELTSTWLVMSFRLLKQPVLVALYGDSGNHAVVAYGASYDGITTQVLFADPNYPATARSMTFVYGTLQPVSIQLNAGAGPTDFQAAIALGASASDPVSGLNGRWADFLSGTSGSDRYPSSIKYEIYDSVADAWDSLPDTVWTSSSTVRVRTRCPDCAVKQVNADPPDLITTAVLNDSGTMFRGNDTIPTPLVSGAHQYVIVAEAPSPSAGVMGKLGFLDSRHFIGVLLHDTLAAAITTVATDSITTSFTQTVSGPLPPHLNYIWNFGDGSRPDTVADTPTATHGYAEAGTYPVTLKGEDPTTHQPVLETALRDSVGPPHFAWQMTSLDVSIDEPSDIGPNADDTVAFNKIHDALNAMQNSPASNAVIVIGDSLGCDGIVVEHFGDGQLVQPVIIRSNTFIGVGEECDGEVLGTVSMTPLGSGSLIGSVLADGNYLSWNSAVSVGTTTISATMSGTSLSGSFVWRAEYDGGEGTYTTTFTATQIAPKPSTPPAGRRAKRTTRKP